MLNKLIVKNLTVFPEIQLQFSQNLNVIVGENGTGKTHLLKILYSALATSGEEGRKSPNGTPTKTLLQTRLADKLIHISLAKVIKIYPFVGNEVRNCRYQQSNSISDQIAVCDFCILMKVSEIF